MGHSMWRPADKLSQLISDLTFRPQGLARFLTPCGAAAGPYLLVGNPIQQIGQSDDNKVSKTTPNRTISIKSKVKVYSVTTNVLNHFMGE